MVSKIQNKEKLKKILLALSTPEEKDALRALDIQTINNKVDALSTINEGKLKHIEDNLDLLLQVTSKEQKNLFALTDNFNTLIDTLSSKLDAVKSTIQSGNDKKKSLETMTFFKDVMGQLGTIATHGERTAGLITNLKWNSSMQVKNTNGSPIDPAVAYPNASTTVTTPYVTIPGFDNAGTVAKVTNLVGLPVNVVTGTISISSPNLSGLQVNITKVTTSAFAGLQVRNATSGNFKAQVQGISASGTVLTSAGNPIIAVGSDYAGTPATQIPKVDSSGTQYVNITGATTSVLSGLKVIVTTNTVGLSVKGTDTLGTSGPTALTVQGIPSGTVLNTSTAPVVVMGMRNSAGNAFYAIGASDNADGFAVTGNGNILRTMAEMVIFNGSTLDRVRGTSGAINMSLTTATTSVLAGTKVFIENFPASQAVTISTPTLAGTQFDLRKIGGNVITTTVPVSGTVTSTLASTSISGLKVNQTQIKGVAVSTGNGTVDTGTMRVAIASDNTAFSVNATLQAGSAAFGKLSANDGVDIGDVTINNAAGGSAVNIQDGGNSITVDGTVTASIATSNLAGLQVDTRKVGGNVVATNNGTASAGVQRVVIASDQTAYSVNATLSAETTKVIGVVRNADGSGNLLTATSNALDVNLKTSSITLGTTANINAATTSVLAGLKTDITKLGGVPISLNTGVRDTGTQRVTIATNDVVPISIATSNLAGLQVDIRKIAGTVAITSGVNGSGAMGGDTNNGATDAGFPMKIGGVGKTANPTAVTDGQRVNAIFDKLGKQIVVGAIRDLKGQTLTSIVSSTTETTIIASAASTFRDLYGLILSNSSATATKVTIRDATAGTQRSIIYVPAGDTRGFMLPVDSAIPQTTSNNNWTATCTTSVATLSITALWVANI